MNCRTSFLFVLVFFSVFVQALSAQTVDGSTPLTINPERSRRIDKIVAVVNEEIILQSDVDRVLATIEAEYKSIYSDPQELAQKIKQAKGNIINQMVEEKLILSEAKRYDIKIGEDRLDRRIEKTKEAFPEEQKFEELLAKQGLRLKDLRDRFYDQEIMKTAVDYFVRSKIKVEPIEIRQFYQAHQEELIHPEQARVKTIFIKVDESGNEYTALRRAKKILGRLKKGENFEDLAKNYSQGVDAQEAGDLGFVEKGELIKEIDEAIFKLEPGEISDVLKTNQGYRIFKLEEKRPKKPLSFSEAQEIIKDILYKKKFAEEFKEWIDELKQNAYIVIK